MIKRFPFKDFNTSPEIIHLECAVHLPHERGIDIRHETVRFWWHRFGSQFALA